MIEKLSIKKNVWYLSGRFFGITRFLTFPYTLFFKMFSNYWEGEFCERPSNVPRPRPQI